MPRLVLLDLMLPDTDGIELMRTVPELADLPVIICSLENRASPPLCLWQNFLVNYAGS